MHRKTFLFIIFGHISVLLTKFFLRLTLTAHTATKQNRRIPYIKTQDRSLSLAIYSNVSFKPRPRKFYITPSVSHSWIWLQPQCIDYRNRTYTTSSLNESCKSNPTSVQHDAFDVNGFQHLEYRLCKQLTVYFTSFSHHSNAYT